MASTLQKIRAKTAMDDDNDNDTDDNDDDANDDDSYGDSSGDSSEQVGHPLERNATNQRMNTSATNHLLISY